LHSQEINNFSALKARSKEQLEKQLPFVFSIEIFETALQRYPNTFCYLWYHPNTGIWIGATPEVFLKAKNTNITTVALAGTIKAEDSKEPIWSTKEIEEQQIVVDYINDSFKESLENVRVSKNQTVKAGAVYHLKSTITGKINENFKLKPLIEKLHPTPAVCGLPKTEALQFIHTNENYDRSYYTGFLGELNAGDASQTHLFVNLRCMKLEGNTASIFVGGGITKDSVPESEWLETQYKSQTMLSLL